MKDIRPPDALHAADLAAALLLLYQKHLFFLQMGIGSDPSEGMLLGWMVSAMP